MQKITIKRSGFYFSFWDESAEDWIEKNINEASIPITWYLSYPIQVDEPLTVREIIKMIEPYAEIINLVMIHELAGIEFSRILEVLNDVRESTNAIEPNSVCLVKIAESIPTKQMDEDINFLSTYPVLVGIQEIDETGENDEVFSLSTIDFLDWCDLPFEIDDYVEYLDQVTEEVLFDGVMNWTLGEIIGSILSQTSVTLQVMQNSISSPASNGEPVDIESIFNWFDDLDRILLK
jgi:hypothetical protein